MRLSIVLSKTKKRNEKNSNLKRKSVLNRKKRFSKYVRICHSWSRSCTVFYSSSQMPKILSQLIKTIIAFIGFSLRRVFVDSLISEQTKDVLRLVFSPEFDWVAVFKTSSRFCLITVQPSPEKQPKKLKGFPNQGLAAVRRCKLSSLYAASFPQGRI